MAADQFGNASAAALKLDADERITINRRAGELTICFGDGTDQTIQFARSLADCALKGRFADLLKLDLHAMEQEMDLALGSTRARWRRRLWR